MFFYVQKSYFGSPKATKGVSSFLGRDTLFCKSIRFIVFGKKKLIFLHSPT